MTRWLNASLNSLTLLALLFVASADAQEIYRWTDQQGKTHYSELVPPAYENVAKPMMVTPPPSPEEQDRAMERAAKDRARAAKASSTAT